MTVEHRRWPILWVGLVLFMIIVLGPVQAANTENGASLFSTSNPVTMEELKTRRGAIESRSDIDGKFKEECLKNIDQAIGYVEISKIAKEKYLEYEQLLRSAPARIKVLEKILKSSHTDKTKPDAVYIFVSVFRFCIQWEIRPRKASPSETFKNVNFPLQVDLVHFINSNTSNDISPGAVRVLFFCA